MNFVLTIVCLVLVLAGGILPAAAGDAHAFLEKYCLECHGEQKQKGDRRYDKLTLPPQNIEAVIELQDIVDQLNLGEMPPKKATQPTTAERLAMVGQLTRAVQAGREQFHQSGGQTVLRRLNRREYLKTVGDLFGLDMRLFDPTTKFPSDQMVAHLDNQGDVLRTSSYLLAEYLDAADQIVEKALAVTERPKETSWNFAGNFIPQAEFRVHRRLFNNQFLCVYEVPEAEKHEGGYIWISEFSGGVPLDGVYEIKVKAQAMNRINPHDPALFQRNTEEPFRLGIVPGDEKAGPLYYPQRIEPRLAEVTVRDGDPNWYTFTVALAAGQTPRFIFPNGPASSRTALQSLGKTLLKPEPNGKQLSYGEKKLAVLRQAQVPHIRISDVQIRGPLLKQWPTFAQQTVFGDKPFTPDRTREILTRFANRAYRRPVQSEEVDHLMRVVEARQSAGHTPFEALKDGLKAVLCSPAFLYISNPDANSPSSPAHVLASRMSYFLWASMPDDELRRLADSGELLKPEIRLAQTRRMMAMRRSDALVEGFLDSWLNLRSLGDMPPNREAFSQYYTKGLQGAMKLETQMFMRDMLDANRSILRFLDADYTFVNQPLATLYGLGKIGPPESAHEFRRVALTDRRRGGLLGMGSVLTVSANGIETSPVTRGVWLLENILGTPPSPPPDNVPPIDPDVRGAKNIRDLLVKHRESPTCFECHQRIDPLGFALESFDPIGGWRTNYPDGRKLGPKIDASGELPGGQSFQDVVGFKQILLNRKGQFAQMLTEKLLSYACGRRIGAADRPQVEQIIAQTVSTDLGLRSLIEAIVLSEAF